MHTFEASGGTIFNYNSDFSGDIHVRLPIRGTPDDGKAFHVPGDDLLDFVAMWVLNQRVSALQDATTEEILGITPRDNDRVQRARIARG